MRVLVVGSGNVLNNAIGCHVIGKLPAATKWNVITSYQTSIDSWAACPNVQNVTAYKDMKDDQPDQHEGLVIEVMAASFFEKQWVKQLISEAKDLMIVTGSPLSVVDKGILESFDQVYIAKTTVSDKQTQYYTLFADTTKITINEFKKMLKGLNSNQYALITLTRGKPGKVQIESFNPVWAAAGGSDGDDEKKHHKTSTVSAAPKASKQAQNPPTGGDEHLDKPQGLAVEDTCVELWLCMSVAPAVTLDQAVTDLQGMLRNELVVTMFSKSMYRKHEEDHTVSVYMQVFHHRQDIFSCLALNMLQALRESNIIAKGSIVIA